MEAHQQRVVDELHELYERRARLQQFIDHETFVSIDPDEQRRLRRQSVIMGLYADTLAERIEHFPK